MLPTSIPRGNVEGCISHTYCEKYRATNKTIKLYQTWKLCYQPLVLVVSQHVRSYYVQQMQVELNPKLIKSSINAGLGWSYWWSVHVGKWRKRANQEGATVQLWWLTTCTLYTSFREWSCSLLKQTRIVLRTALWINLLQIGNWVSLTST